MACYGVALAVTRWNDYASKLFSAVFQQRFALPVWELTIMSGTIMFGGIMEVLVCSIIIVREADFKKQRTRASAVAVEAPEGVVAISDLDELIKHARSELHFKNTSG